VVVDRGTLQGKTAAPFSARTIALEAAICLRRVVPT
jgi:hypothetical protein